MYMHIQFGRRRILGKDVPVCSTVRSPRGYLALCTMTEVAGYVRVPDNLFYQEKMRLRKCGVSAPGEREEEEAIDTRSVRPST